MAGKKHASVSSRQGNVPPAADAMPADDRRTDQAVTRSDALPEIEIDQTPVDTVGGGTTPKIDGGNAQHPIHDEDEEDRMPSDYEREIDRIDATTRSDT